MQQHFFLNNPSKILAVAALNSCTVFAASLHDALRPFYLMASFLPLQLVALYWLRLTQFSRRSKLLASDRFLPVVHSADVFRS